eukprot:366410-Chlamydomonas_euryale.AAC.21
MAAVGTHARTSISARQETVRRRPCRPARAQHGATAAPRATEPPAARRTSMSKAAGVTLTSLGRGAGRSPGQQGLQKRNACVAAHAKARAGA